MNQELLVVTVERNSSPRPAKGECHRVPESEAVSADLVEGGWDDPGNPWLQVGFLTDPETCNLELIGKYFRSYEKKQGDPGCGRFVPTNHLRRRFPDDGPFELNDGP